jgi:hypothetical protein
MRAFALILAMASLASAAAPEEAPPIKQFKRKAVGKGAIAGATAGALFEEAENNPHEWGRTWGGLGKRFASTFGKHAIKSGIQVTVGTIRHEELSYRPSGKHGFGPRVKYALVSVVITRNTTTGKKTFAAGEVSGAVGSGLISRLWMPVRLHTVGSGLGSAVITVGFDAGVNVAKEFWPEIRHAKRTQNQIDH